jgi:hypothetical protein
MEEKQTSRLLAEKVMGFKVETHQFHYDGVDQSYEIWIDKDGNKHNPVNFLEDFQEAWKIADKLRLTITPSLNGWSAFHANTSRSERDCQYIGTTNNQVWAEHENPEAAICMAALNYYGIKYDV